MLKIARCVLAGLLIALSGCAVPAPPAGDQAAPAAAPQPVPVSLLPPGAATLQPIPAAAAPPPMVAVRPAPIPPPRPVPVATIPAPAMIVYPWAPAGPCRVCSVDHISVQME